MLGDRKDKYRWRRIVFEPEARCYNVVDGIEPEARRLSLSMMME
jgi:hypothetical protein